MKTLNLLGGAARAGAGLLAALVLGACPQTGMPELWCGTLAVHEKFFVPSAGGVDQDFATEQRCVPLVRCTDTQVALVLDPQEGQCTVLVDFPGLTEGTVLPGSHCTTSRNRLGGTSRDLGTTTGGTLSLSGEQLVADIDWDMELRTGEFTRLGAVQHYALRNGIRSFEPTKQDTEEACKKPEPAGEPEDFSSLVGCAPEDFADRTDESAERTVRFGNELGAQYSPRCMSISVGQKIALEGPFNTYSLSPGLPASIATGAPYPPFAYVFGGAHSEFTFPRAGDYIFSNPPNAERGMKGLIRVR